MKKKLKVARPLEAISKASARDHRVDRRGTRTAMARRRQNAKAAKNTKNGGATVGYEAQLWQMADALRGSMDAAEYKHVVPLYRHQEQAPEVGRSGRSFVVTTGTGSGKTEASREAGAMFQFLFRFWRREWPAVPFDEIRKRSRLLVIDDQEFRSRQSG